MVYPPVIQHQGRACCEIGQQDVSEVGHESSFIHTLGMDEAMPRGKSLGRHGSNETDTLLFTFRGMVNNSFPPLSTSVATADVQVSARLIEKDQLALIQDGYLLVPSLAGGGISLAWVECLFFY